MSPASILRHSSATPREWRFVTLVDCIRAASASDAPRFSVRLASTFNLIDAGLRRCSHLGAAARCEDATLPEALAAGAELERQLAANQKREG